MGRRAPNLGLCKVHKNFQQCGKFLCKTENFPKPKIQHFAQKSAYAFVQIDEGCSKLHKKLTSSLCNLPIENGFQMCYNSINELRKEVITMTSYSIKAINPDRKDGKKITQGDIREWSLCDYYGVKRTTHDSKAYDKDSDLNVNDLHISIKASGFSLMSGKLCEGREDFDGIWALFESRVHSNRFAYITKDFTVYEMDIHEFKKFVYTFCYINRESTQNGGRKKIKALSESKKMCKWLAAQVAA